VGEVPRQRRYHNQKVRKRHFYFLKIKYKYISRKSF
jgi:hypothetical protein